jgi:GTP-binding protein
MALRKAEMIDMRPSGGGKTRITLFYAPSRGLIGYQGEFLSDTRGTGIMNRLFQKYGPYKGEIEGRRNGVLISNGAGRGGGLCAWNALEDRGDAVRFARRAVYEGMIIGEQTPSRNDLEVNPMKSKQLTNFRTTRQGRRDPPDAARSA